MVRYIDTVGDEHYVDLAEAASVPFEDGRAHRLFHADSRNILDYLHHRAASPHDPTIGRRELSILLCSALMRGAGQDWYEQGDIWHRVAAERPISADTPLDRLHSITPALLRLLTAGTGPGRSLGPPAFTADWATAFAGAGEALRGKACEGSLTRGIRGILAHHVIFHWNRIGLPARTQSILAAAARAAVFREQPREQPPDQGQPAQDHPRQQVAAVRATGQPTGSMPGDDIPAAARVPRSRGGRSGIAGAGSAG